MLKLCGITKDYKMADTTVHALKGISLNFRKSEFVAVLGPSGCGKTTMLNIIGGLDRYTDGDLFIKYKSTKEYSARDWDRYRNQTIGFIFQSYNLIPHLNVLQNVELALTISGVPRSKKRAMAVDALTKVGLAEQLKKKPSQMSGGQMQRVAIARAIVNNPEIILADEPTGALDSTTSEQIMDLLQEISDDRLVIMVTHNPELAARYSTRTINLFDGEVISDSNPYDGLPTVLEPVKPIEDESRLAHDAVAMSAKLKRKAKREKRIADALEKKKAADALNASDNAQNAADAAGAYNAASVGGGDYSALNADNSTLNADNANLDADTLNADNGDELNAAENVTDNPRLSSDNEIYGKPHTEQSDEKFVATISPEAPEKLTKRTKQPKEKKPRSSMSFFTSLSLSARNLWSKKARSGLTAFAGSIGIIGIALVLSLSNGFSVYMDDLERSTLSIMPVTISSVGISVNVNEAMSVQSEGGSAYPDTDYITPYEPDNSVQGVKVSANIITDSYVDYVRNIDTSLVSSIQYNHSMTMNVLTKNASGTVTRARNKNIGWQELLWDDYTMAQYEVLAGGYPGSKEANELLSTYDDSYSNYVSDGTEKAHQVVLIVTQYNTLKTGILSALGYDVDAQFDPNTNTYQPIYFTDFIGKQLKVEHNDDYYKLNSSGLYSAQTSSSAYQNAWNSDKSETITVVGIMRVKKSVMYPFLSQGLAYTEDLTNLALSNAAESQIAIDQQSDEHKDINLLTGASFSSDMSSLVSLFSSYGFTESQLVTLVKSTLSNLYSSSSDSEMMAEINECERLNDITATLEKYGKSVSAIKTAVAIMVEMQLGINRYVIIELLNSAYQTQLQLIGASDRPTAIYIYPASYDAKDKVLDYLDEWNEGKTSTETVTYTDLASTVSEVMRQVVDIVSYVLIAFAAISLVVSSIMIAIITYISVLERTVEIGVLRSIGARKIDIANVFNAETFISGAISGILGVTLAWLIDFPLNYWISTLVEQAPPHLAQLSPLHALILVALSIVLNMVAGLIPSIIASKKDPVTALRSGG